MIRILASAGTRFFIYPDKKKVLFSLSAVLGYNMITNAMEGRL